MTYLTQWLEYRFHTAGVIGSNPIVGKTGRNPWLFKKAIHQFTVPILLSSDSWVRKSGSTMMRGLMLGIDWDLTREVGSLLFLLSRRMKVKKTSKPFPSLAYFEEGTQPMFASLHKMSCSFNGMKLAFSAFFFWHSPWRNEISSHSRSESLFYRIPSPKQGSGHRERVVKEWYLYSFSWFSGRAPFSKERRSY